MSHKSAQGINLHSPDPQSEKPIWHDESTVLPVDEILLQQTLYRSLHVGVNVSVLNVSILNVSKRDSGYE